MCKTITLYFLEIHQVKSNIYGSAPQHELQENNFFFFQRVNFISVLLYFILLSFNLKWCPENSPLVNFPPGEIRPIKFFPVNYAPVNYHVAKFPPVNCPPMNSPLGQVRVGVRGWVGVRVRGWVGVRIREFEQVGIHRAAIYQGGI